MCMQQREILGLKLKQISYYIMLITAVAVVFKVEISCVHIKWKMCRRVLA